MNKSTNTMLVVGANDNEHRGNKKSALTVRF